MIEVMNKLDNGVCRNCGSQITLYKGDLSLDPQWYHEVGGRVRRECPTSTYAEPSECKHGMTRAHYIGPAHFETFGHECPGPPSTADQPVTKLPIVYCLRQNPHEPHLWNNLGQDIQCPGSLDRKRGVTSE